MHKDSLVQEAAPCRVSISILGGFKKYHYRMSVKISAINIYIYIYIDYLCQMG